MNRAIIVIGVTWLAYASAYFLRKPLGVLKPSFEKELGFDASLLGFLDVALLLPYALVQMFAGHWVERVGARRMLSGCLLLASAATITFGTWRSFSACFLLIFVEGASQALMWPSCIRLVDQWTEEGKKTTVMGVYGSSAFVGGIFGTFLAVAILKAFGWSMVYPILSCVVFLMGIIVYFTCFEKKVIPQSAMEMPEPSPADLVSSPSTEAVELSWKNLWQKPGFADVCLCMLCMKVNRYFVYMWLPYLYTKEFGYTEASAGSASTGFEVGGFFGSFFIGFLIDSRFQGDVFRGTSVAVTLALISMIAFTFSSALTSLLPLWLPQLVFIAINGASNAGADAMLSSAIPARMAKLYGGSSATLTGLINGFGTMGSFVQSPLSGFVGERFSWTMNLYLMAGLNLVAVITVIRARNKFHN